MLKFLLILYSSILVLYTFGQTEINWTDLELETKEEWNEEYQAIIDFPIFSQKQLDLANTYILIQGYTFQNTTMLDSLSPFYITSSAIPYRFRSCYPIQAIEIEFKNQFYSDSQKKIQLKGKLVLNINDFNKLNLILKDAEIIK